LEIGESYMPESKEVSAWPHKMPCDCVIHRALATAPPEQAVVTVNSGDTTISSGMARDLGELGPTAVNSAATGADEHVGPLSGVSKDLKEFIGDKVMAGAVKGYETGWKHGKADQSKAISGGALDAADVEKFAAELHEVYWQESIRQRDTTGLIPRHRRDYNELSEDIKDYDRALARYILAALASHDKKVRREVIRSLAGAVEKEK
jgi:hypothetical protein